jgi:hypothetical protein
MESNSFDRFFKNINNMMSLIEVIPKNHTNNSGSIFTRICLSFAVSFLTDFEFKLNIDNDNNRELLDLTNQFLQTINSKFLINDDMNELEYINFVLYLFVEFDVINDYIEYIKNYDKKHATISFENIFSLNQQYRDSNGKDENNLPDHILPGFNRVNFIFKNFKKQIDLFVNLCIKLNQIKENQPKPHK